jgi:hypothetical protein
MNQSIKKITFFKNEKVSVLPFKRTAKGYKYAVTNYGRVISFTDEVKFGKVLHPTSLSGYPGLSFRIGEKRKNINIHRLVATAFLAKPSKKHNKVIHLNFKKDDNHYKNLKWATIEQQAANTKKNPNYSNRGGNFKLTETNVRKIKLLLQKGKATLKAIAKKYGISDMQVYRIKSEENWAHVKI